MKFGLTKKSTDHSRPIPKKDLVLVYVDDIEEMPRPNDKGILALEELKIKQGATFHDFYLTPSTQKLSVDVEDETMIKGFTPKINGSFPGTSLEVAEWFYQNLNKGFVAIHKGCGKECKLYGTIYNPLFVGGVFQDDDDQNLTEFEFAAAKRSKRPFFIFNYTDNGGGGASSSSQLLIDHLGL